MGIGRFIRQLFDQDFAIQDTIRIQEETYHNIKWGSPGHDEHEYLARVWLSRAQTRGLNPSTQDAQANAWAETMMFACLPAPQNIRALAIRLLFDEVPPHVMAKYPALLAEYNSIMAPVLAVRDQGEKALTRLYSARNPQLAARHGV